MPIKCNYLLMFLFGLSLILVSCSSSTSLSPDEHQSFSLVSPKWGDTVPSTAPLKITKSGFEYDVGGTAHYGQGFFKVFLDVKPNNSRSNYSGLISSTDQFSLSNLAPGEHSLVISMHYSDGQYAGASDSAHFIVRP